MEINAEYKNNVLHRRRKRIFDYECANETPIVPQLNYKITFFLQILDTILNSLNDRFELLSSHVNTFNFFM